MGTIGTLHNLGGAIGLALGTLIYNLLAKKTLLYLLEKNNSPAGTWVDQAIANTKNAMQILQKNTHFDMDSITAIFQHYFLRSYQGAMWLTIAVCILALIAVVTGLKNQKPGSRDQVAG